jgi:hypothetical protein
LNTTFESFGRLTDADVPATIVLGDCVEIMAAMEQSVNAVDCNLPIACQDPTACFALGKCAYVHIEEDKPLPTSLPWTQWDRHGHLDRDRLTPPVRNPDFTGIPAASTSRMEE